MLLQHRTSWQTIAQSSGRCTGGREHTRGDRGRLWWEIPASSCAGAWEPCACCGICHAQLWRAAAVGAYRRPRSGPERKGGGVRLHAISPTRHPASCGRWWNARSVLCGRARDATAKRFDRAGDLSRGAELRTQGKLIPIAASLLLPLPILRQPALCLPQRGSVVSDSAVTYTLTCASRIGYPSSGR